MAKQPLSDEELLAQLSGLSGPPAAATTTTTRPPKPSKAAAPPSEDPLAALESLAIAKPKPISRPNTPKLSSGARRAGTTADATHTPASTESPRNSDDRARAAALSRKSGESTTPLQHELTPTSEDEAREHALKQQQQSGGGGGGWWGGIFASATAAVTQAQAAVKDIQKNEEALKWATQVKGNVDAIKGFGGELRSRAIPTFTDILNTIAPPISQHERLQIHITHDFIGYPSLDPSIYATFSRVMSQVEGGDLLVIQRGSESRGSSNASKSGWSDGPWWRDGQVKRDLGIINGLSEGTKLARANAEAYASEYFAANGGVEQATKQATEIPSEANPVRSSDIFLAIQAVGFENDGLFQAPAEQKTEGGMVEEEAKDERVCFAIYLHDPVHAITLKTLTQSFPRKWAEWLDAEQDPESELKLPTEIVDIVTQGGIDPREWISEWTEETLGLGVGIIAQRYVAKRMGVGEAGQAKGKAAKPAVEAGAGELARAI